MGDTESQTTSISQGTTSAEVTDEECTSSEMPDEDSMDSQTTDLQFTSSETSDEDARYELIFQKRQELLTSIIPS
ncbi:unnamed protein product [Rotaria magnacalcarata]|uniref:Uncharacterized protein n=1 Tax=Rotaria magnacalcarata TaxID=392030 RepID=A0A820BS79_9BILA|nr:unnamed protein product [Rotaria magnacalcarata]